MEQKINEENIEINCVFCIDLFLEIRDISNVYFLFRLNLDFGFFINNYETDCISERFRKKEWIWVAISEAICLLNSLPLEKSDDLSNKRYTTLRNSSPKFTILIWTVYLTYLLFSDFSFNP